MALKWIKLKTDIFTSDKMLLLETYEDGLYYQMIWLKLLCLAGRKENHGIFTMRDGRGYTAPMLSHILSVDTDMLEDALSVFEELCMISNDGGIIKILGWREHQEDYFDEEEPCEAEEITNAKDIERQKVRDRVRKHRERKRQAHFQETEEGSHLPQDNVTPSVTEGVTCNITGVTPSVTSVTPLININNRTEKNKEEHTSLREEREKNKKENPVTLTGDGKSLFLNAKGNENSLIVNIEGTDALSSSQPPASLHSPDEVCAMDEQCVRKSFGVFDNVMLSEDEYERFQRMYEWDYEQRIDELSIYLAQSGKEYKSHYATLLSFARMRYAKNSPHPYQSKALQDYSSTASGPPSLTREGLKYADFDPEEELQKAIRRSGFFDDED